VLEALIRAGGGRLSGVRYSVGYDADLTIGNSRSDSAPHIYARPEVRAGVARLAARGLALDAWCYHPQLADVIALARAVPQATIVMCHAGRRSAECALGARLRYLAASQRQPVGCLPQSQ
jgi:L-fuconolactonase